MALRGHGPVFSPPQGHTCPVPSEPSLPREAGFPLLLFVDSDPPCVSTLAATHHRGAISISNMTFMSGENVALALCGYSFTARRTATGRWSLAGAMPASDGLFANAPMPASDGLSANSPMPASDGLSANSPMPASDGLSANSPMPVSQTANAGYTPALAPFTSGVPVPAAAQSAYGEQPRAPARAAPTYHGDDAAAALASAGMARFQST